MKLRSYTLVLIALLQWIPQSLQAQDTSRSKACYASAKLELEKMLNGKQPLSYERAIYLIENAWWDNQIDYAAFQQVLDRGTQNIRYIMANSKLKPKTKDDEPKTFFEALSEKNREDQGYADKLIANHAIYKYMTDTIQFVETSDVYTHLPYRYATTDPLGSNDWTNTQVFNLIDNHVGNCFALVSLFKIYAERLHSDADICCAPGHVYITHMDEKGAQYNVEIAGKAFPGIGTLSTLTHSTQAGIENDISLRQLNLKQSVALCLVYLAKGYEHKLGIHEDDFILACAEKALEYDGKNLNALLLKSEIMEERLMAKNISLPQLRADKTFKEYEALITHLYTLGYREMPLDMKNLMIKGWMRDTITQLSDKSCLASSSKAQAMLQSRRASLSWGLFEEQITDKPIERYGRVLYNTKQHKITGFAKEQVLYNNYNFDPVAFAMNVDPMAHKMPGWSPYTAMADNPILNFDPDGAFPYSIHVRSFAPYSTFGLGFSGDGRGYSTGAGKRFEGGNITSRIQQSFTVDPTASTLIGLHTWSDESHHAGFTSKTGNPSGNISNFTTSKDNSGNSTVSFTSNYAGNLPLLPSADIDVHTSFTLTENTRSGRLDVTAIQRGDQFPAAETFIGDSKGNKLFIGVSPAVGFDDMQSFGPYQKLPGDNNLPMMRSSFSISIDKNGVFTGVTQGDKSYSTNEWNNMMQSQPTTKPQEKPLPAK